MTSSPSAAYDPRVVTYKQPRRINAVSVTLAVLVVLAGYLGFHAWPVIALNADLKNALEDAMPKLYHANLLPEPEATVSADQVRQALVDKMTELGVEDADGALTINRDSERVSLSAHVNTAVRLGPLGFGKTIPWTLSPAVETSATRVSY